MPGMSGTVVVQRQRQLNFTLLRNQSAGFDDALRIAEEHHSRLPEIEDLPRLRKEDLNLLKATLCERVHKLPEQAIFLGSKRRRITNVEANALSVSLTNLFEDRVVVHPGIKEKDGWVVLYRSFEAYIVLVYEGGHLPKTLVGLVREGQKLPLLEIPELRLQELQEALSEGQRQEQKLREEAASKLNSAEIQRVENAMMAEEISPLEAFVKDKRELEKRAMKLIRGEEPATSA